VKYRLDWIRERKSKNGKTVMDGAIAD